MHSKIGGYMKKFLVCCCAVAALEGYCHEGDFYCVKEYNEDSWVNDYIRDPLKKLGLKSDICFCGKIHLLYHGIHQDVQKDMESNSFVSDGVVDFRYRNKSANHAEGFEITVGTNSGIIKDKDAIVKGAFIFVEADKLGELRIGYSVGASERFLTDGTSILCGYRMPASGNLNKIYNKSTGTIVQNGFVYADGNAAKIMWFTPTINGFSGALSYTPNGRLKKPFKTVHKKMEFENEKYDFANDRATAKNILAAALNYECGSQDGFNFHMNLSGIIGKAITNTRNKGDLQNLKAYSIGAILGYKDVKMALGFTDNCKSLLTKKYASGDVPQYLDAETYDLAANNIGVRSNADSGKLYSAGLRWDINKKLAVSAGYFKSIVKFASNNKAKAQIYTVAAEHYVNKNISVYIEYNNVKTDTCNAALTYSKACSKGVTKNNKANIISVGAAIKF